MSIAAKLDTHGRGAWLALMVVSFIVFWPLGLFILVYMLWSGRMSNWSKFMCNKAENDKSCLGFPKMPGKWHIPASRPASSSGNRAFDEYREATLQRLEEEQREFLDYMERLRQARDKQEFDQFMAERRTSVHDINLEDDFLDDSAADDEAGKTASGPAKA